MISTELIKFDVACSIWQDGSSTGRHHAHGGHQAGRLQMPCTCHGSSWSMIVNEIRGWLIDIGVGLPGKFFRSWLGPWGITTLGWPNITESVTFALPTCCFSLEKLAGKRVFCLSHQEEFNVISPLPIDIKLNHNETEDALMEPRRRWGGLGNYKKSLRPHAKCCSSVGILKHRVKTCENYRQTTDVP